MQDENITQFLLAKKNEISKLKNSKYESREFAKWHNSLDMLLHEICGEERKEYKDFKSIHFFPMVIGGDADYRPEDHKAYLEGLNKMDIFLGGVLEKINCFGVASIKNKAHLPVKGSPGHKAVVQNVYLSQYQIQNINQRLNVETLAPEIKKMVELLLEELKKEKTKDKGKVREIMKWLADKSIDTLIALLIPR